MRALRTKNPVKTEKKVRRKFYAPKIQRKQRIVVRRTARI